MAMSPGDLAMERRDGRVAGTAAIAAGVLVLLAWIGALVIGRPPDSNRGRLLHFHDHASQLVIVYCMRALGVLLLTIAAMHLYRAAKARNRGLPSVARVTGVLGPVAVAVSTAGTGIALAVISADYADRSVETAQAAHDAFREPALIVFGALAFAGGLALAFWFVLAAMNTMRVGLLTRFMGVLGVIVGPILVFVPTLLVDPLLSFWLIALGALFWGWWPRGVPAAWSAGEARAWPPLGQLDTQTATASAGPHNGEVDAVGPGVKRPDAGDRDATGAQRSRRKRKKRS